ncbi:unnamed protein product [Ilex paraguariensis]|uniref:Uncharacterized protein n=1 Tax=Ilex paraguariensis TaxID=185542 RepID=A0ABC8U154_9AQUA
MHSTSKFSLRGLGVLTKEPACQRKKTTKKHFSDPQVSVNMEAGSNKMMFPKLTVSPLRRFQLIDSDSDSDFGDPCFSEGANRGTNKLDSSLKERPSSNSGQRAASIEQWKTKESVSMACTEDLWKDFCSEKGFHIPTPALDEVCEEYFRSVKDKNVAKNSNKGCHENSNVRKNDEQQWDVGNASVHRYFFHDDPRIQKLVRSRLPNFFPVGAVNNRGYKPPDASVIDYMGQFGNGEGSKQADGKHNSEVGSRRSRNNSKKSKAEELPQGSGSWMNPKRCTEIPKDAGKRRVHAVGQSAGHWYTGPDGKRVTVCSMSTTCKVAIDAIRTIVPRGVGAAEVFAKLYFWFSLFMRIKRLCSFWC